MKPNVRSSIAGNGRTENVRFEYMDQILSRNYPDSTTSKVMTSPQVKNQIWSVENMATSGYSPKRPY